MVSMARPFLADPEFVIKAAEDRADEINTCIACNQACLDHVFKQKRASCLVNPRACFETELNFGRVPQPKKLAVVGAGPAGPAPTTASFLGWGTRPKLSSVSKQARGLTRQEARFCLNT